MSVYKRFDPMLPKVSLHRVCISGRHAGTGVICTLRTRVFAPEIKVFM
ncbi:MAG TPA: hypothetical protein ACQGQH_03315 [Xylella sp.]